MLVSHTIVGNGSYRSRTAVTVPERHMPFHLNGSYRFRTAVSVSERHVCHRPINDLGPTGDVFMCILYQECVFLLCCTLTPSKV